MLRKKYMFALIEQNSGNVMIYSNDDADKSARQKDFILSVYVYPSALALFICILVYLASSKDILSRPETILGYAFSFMPASLLFVFARKKWLRMPDGEYIRIQKDQLGNAQSAGEPAEYDAEYFISRQEKVLNVIFGIGGILFALWLIYDHNLIMGALVMGFGSIAILIGGIVGLSDKSAHLKLGKTGIWTKDLGFVEWKKVKDVKFVENKNSRTPQTFIEIYLSGTEFEKAGKPDDSFNLNDLKGSEYIETIVENLRTQYENQVAV